MSEEVPWQYLLGAMVEKTLHADKPSSRMIFAAARGSYRGCAAAPGSVSPWYFLFCSMCDSSAWLEKKKKYYSRQ
jgi:hypothetical protein